MYIRRDHNNQVLRALLAQGQHATCWTFFSGPGCLESKHHLEIDAAAAVAAVVAATAAAAVAAADAAAAADAVAADDAAAADAMQLWLALFLLFAAVASLV